MFLSRNEISKSKITTQLFYLYLLLYLVITPLVLNSITFFIDFDSYDAIIKGGIAEIIYDTEPVTAYFLTLLHRLSLGAFALYSSTWIIAFILFLFILVNLGKSYGVLYLYLILNPVSLILLQFSRQYLAFLFFLMSIFFIRERFKSIFYLILSVFSHNASSVFSIIFYFFYKISFWLLLVSISFLIIGFYFVAIVLFPEYTVHEVQKGRGSIIIASLSFLFFMFLSIKRPKVFIVLLLLLLFLLFSYSISPQAGRFAPYFITLVTFYGLSSFSTKRNIILIHIFLILNILVSLFIVAFGLYGFGA